MPRLESWGAGSWRTPDGRYRIFEQRRVRRIGTAGQRIGWVIVDDALRDNQNRPKVVGTARKLPEARRKLDEYAEQIDTKR
jgi:hypothetical protein